MIKSGWNWLFTSFGISVFIGILIGLSYTINSKLVVILTIILGSIFGFFATIIFFIGLVMVIKGHIEEFRIEPIYSETN